MIKEINHILDIGITELVARILELIPEEFVVSLSIDIFQDIFQILEVVVISSSSDTCICLNIPVILGPVFRIFKAVCPECQGRAKITSQFRHRSPAFRSCKATLMHVKPGLFYSKSGFAVYPGW